MTDTGKIQDHAIDETTEVTPQHFDEEGYVVGHPHHTAVTSDDLGPDGRLIVDGELSEPDETIVLADPDASIAPPPDEDPARPPLLPDGIPGGPDPAPEAPTPYDPTPDEPAPFAPDESVDPDRTPGGRAF